MPEPSLHSETLDCLAEERRRDVEGPHGHGCRPQKTGRVRIMMSLLRGFTETLEY